MQTLDKVLYTAHATALAGRNGKVSTDDHAIDLTVVPPKEMGGPGGGTNPEQLFAAGYAACFGSALTLVAKKMKLQPTHVVITAHVKLGPVGQAYGLAVELVADVAGVPRDQAQAALEAAHQVCPYSNATRGNIAVDIRLA